MEKVKTKPMKKIYLLILLALVLIFNFGCDYTDARNAETKIDCPCIVYKITIDKASETVYAQDRVINDWYFSFRTISGTYQIGDTIK